MDETAELMQQLDGVRHACAAGDWESAEDILRDHDRKVREAVRRENADRLRELAAAQVNLIADMQAWRSEAAEKIGQQRARDRAVNAYKVE